ncbi:MAG: hypothetical protein ABS52_19460 [Gemmatimonadetes bacterium SCN 70-22]|nr:MAG: hypothetical protein ABS52_19460 [Gemmatimonadetes bacterium SCN 70-22]
MLRQFNLALRFVLEVCALGALALWGARQGDGRARGVALSIALPVAVATFWGLFVSPRARFGLPRALRLLLGLGVFLAAATALAAAGHTRLGVIFGGISILNSALTHAWDAPHGAGDRRT